MRLKFSTILLWTFSVLSILLAFKASDEPVPSILQGTWIDSFFQQFDTGNSIIFSLSIGFIISVFFYILVVWLPNKQRKNLIKRNFEEHYRSYKHDIISTLLFACQGTYDVELPLKLSDQSEFVKYFREPISDNPRDVRWYAVVNGLKEQHLKSLLVSMEVFMNEVAYVLNNVEINDPEVFAFFKRLSQAVYQLKNSTLGYEEIKPIESFIWQILGGFDIIDGQRNYDIVKEMIDKI